MHAVLLFPGQGPSANACAADHLTQHATRNTQHATRNTQHATPHWPSQSNPSNPLKPTDTDAWENNSWQSEQSLASKDDYYTRCMRKEKRPERHVHMKRKWRRPQAGIRNRRRETRFINQAAWSFADAVT